jgi:CRISPR-associated protein Csm2
MNNKNNNTKPQEEIFLEKVKYDFGEENYKSILVERKDENKFIDYTKKLVNKYKNDISTSQLRNIFSKIKRINNYKELYALRPKLAYTYGRAERKDGMKKLLVLLDDQIKKVDSNDKLMHFKDFFESIIAYHKFYGGKD